MLHLALLLSACKDDPPPTPDDSTSQVSCYELADGSCVEETFANPPVSTPDDDGVHTLTVGPTEWTVEGQRHCVRSYNGGYPGPTLEIPARTDAERKVRVDIRNVFTRSDFNSLEGGSCSCTDSQGEDCSPHGACGMDMGCVCVDEEGDSCEHAYDFNLTNLHFHGAHVEPDFANGGGCTANGDLACRDCDAHTCDGDESDNTCFFGDDVLSPIPPGTGHQHRYDLDEDGTHHEGTNWYHPHIHGTTALQVGSGAAGAILVRGPLDELEGLADARERVLVYSTPSVNSNGFEPLEDGVACTEDTLTFNDFPTLGSTQAPQMNVINGARQPRMVTAPGQVERWRIVHAGFLDEVFLGVFKGQDSSCSSWSATPDDALPLHQIARDGLTLATEFESDFLFMSPGYRIDLVLEGQDLKDGETWCMVAGRFLQEGPGAPQAPTEAPSVDDVHDLMAAGDLIAILNVASSYGEATQTEPPDYSALAALSHPTTLKGVSIEDRCAAAAEQDPETIDQVAILQVGVFTADDLDPCECDNYNVNCKNFGETDRTRYPYDRDLPLGEVEHWRVSASVDGHPFHLHINPFLVCPNDNIFDPIPFAHWRDTYLVNLDRKVDLVTEYNHHTGAFVFHCHKLTHEDEGMMQVVRTCDQDDPTCGDYGWRTCDEDDLQCVQHLAATDCAAAADNEVEAAACITGLGTPDGVCGPNACVDDQDCGPGKTCQGYVCGP